MQLFTNNADSELNGAIASGTLSITLKTGGGAKFPSPTGGNFFLVTLYQKLGAAELNHEIVKCTARSGDVLTIVRAQEGTTARAFSNADPLELRVTAGSLSVGDVTLVDAQTLTNKTIHGNANTLTADGTNAVGFRHIPQVSQSAAYTLSLTDAGKHILHPSADTTARTFTIPANASVAFPIGSAITFVNQASAGVITIDITTDVMRLAGAGTTGSRTLAANGVATAIKLTATEWIISGNGLT